jgi:hypothetical protein
VSSGVRSLRAPFAAYAALLLETPDEDQGSLLEYLREQRLVSGTESTLAATSAGYAAHGDRPSARTGSGGAMLELGIAISSIHADNLAEMNAGMSLQPTQDETLPPQPTPLLGRESEVAALRRLLDNPACRLLTLCGPGGIGKTRLAIEVATQVRHQFADGVAFTALQHVASAPFLASTIADALRLPLQGQGDTATQLLQALHGRQLLLVLDNFEHLLDGVDLLLRILRAAPEVTVLVTSREVLNLREEWLFPVAELDLPGDDTSAELF